MILTEFTNFIGQCSALIRPEYGLVGGLFLMGLIGGFSHCVAMCGPFVMSQQNDFKKLSDAALIPYHLGRITTYIILTLILFSMVNLIAFFSPMRVFIIAPLLAFAGLLFIVNSLPKLQIIFPWVTTITLPIPKPWISKLFSKTSNRFLTGLVLGLMPCGLLIAAMMAAVTAPTYFTAGLAMSAFGVGTMPALIITAMGGKKLKEKFPKHVPAIRTGFMVWSGLWLCVVAAMMVMEG